MFCAYFIFCLVCITACFIYLFILYLVADLYLCCFMHFFLTVFLMDVFETTCFMHLFLLYLVADMCICFMHFLSSCSLFYVFLSSHSVLCIYYLVTLCYMHLLSCCSLFYAFLVLSFSVLCIFSISCS
jgi:hypothetical protein